MMLHHTIRRAGLTARPVIFLHGSGGDETDLIDFADRVASRRPAIFLRGGLPWEHGYAFFRRHPDRSLDLADLDQRASEIGLFLSALRKGATLLRKPVLIGFSNGAIMAETLMRRFPRLIAGAVLIRPLSPALAGEAEDLAGKPLLLTAGSRDERRDPDDAARCAAVLKGLGASVALQFYETGHGWDEQEADDIQSWLERYFPD
jgi:phospholipase/carboxylesterase